MAKDRGRGDGGGVSFRSVDAIDVGLFSSGPARVKEAVFTPYTYRGQNTPVNLLLVTYERKGEQPYEQPYGIGKGWKIKNGELIPTAGQTGLPKTCNAMKYFIKPLEEALEKAKLDPDDYLSGDKFPSACEGLDVIVARVDQEKRSFSGSKRRGKDDDDKDRTILTIEAVGDEAEAEDEDEKPKGKSARRSRDDDDDEDKPKGKSKSRGRDADDDDADDDEDEQPTRRGKANGKAKDDDADEGDDDALFEEGVEALIAALEANDNTLALDDLSDALDVELKGHKNRKAIIALMDDAETLEREKGWTFNAKKKTITLD